MFDNKVLDLYELYNLVVEKGGLVEVINKKQWQEIIKVVFLQSFYRIWFDRSTCLPKGSPPSPVNNVRSVHVALAVHSLPLSVRVRAEEPESAVRAANGNRVTQEGGSPTRLRRPPIFPPPRLPPLPHHLILLPSSPPTVSHLSPAPDELARLTRFHTSLFCHPPLTFTFRNPSWLPWD